MRLHFTFVCSQFPSHHGSTHDRSRYFLGCEDIGQSQQSGALSVRRPKRGPYALAWCSQHQERVNLRSLVVEPGLKACSPNVYLTISTVYHQVDCITLAIIFSENLTSSRYNLVILAQILRSILINLDNLIKDITFFVRYKNICPGTVGMSR